MVSGLLIAAMFKAKLGISEIIVTILLNYIAINLLGIASQDLPHGPGRKHTSVAKLDPSVTLYRFLKPTRLHAGFIIAVLMVFLVWFILERQRWDMKSRWWGFNKRAAACNGISVVRNIIISAFLSGGLAGIAGAVEVMGVQRKLLEESPGVRIHSGAHRPSGLQPSPGRALCRHRFAALEVGANSMQRQMGVPSAIVNILVGLIIAADSGQGAVLQEEKGGEKPC